MVYIQGIPKPRHEGRFLLVCLFSFSFPFFFPCQKKVNCFYCQGWGIELSSHCRRELLNEKLIQAMSPKVFFSFVTSSPLFMPLKPLVSIKQQSCERYYARKQYGPVGDNYCMFAQCSSLWGDFRIKFIQMQEALIVVMSPADAEVLWITSSAQNQREVIVKVSPPDFPVIPGLPSYSHLSHRNRLRCMFKFHHHQNVPWLKQSRNGSPHLTDEKNDT